MKNNYMLHLCRCFVFGLVSLSGSAWAQTDNQLIKITYPVSRAVFQRENDNRSTIYLSGNYYQPVDSVQARVVAEVTGQGFNTAWTTIQRNPQGGIFQGAIRVQGGWYRLEVQGFAGGNVISTSVVRKVGVGEVFIITGQSNAQGFQNFGATGAADDRVNCVTYDNSKANSLADPPAPSFQQLNATALIGPRGQSAWCWGVLGDLIAKQYNVPVLFINTAWQGTVIHNWKESSDGQITKNIFALGTPDENFPTGMPYANLIIALRYYASLQGLRAVLWQQGENDNVPLNSSRQTYASNMQYLVNKTRADTDRYPAWVLARSSYNSGKVSQDIIQAQNDVINTYNNNVFAGPFTDNIQIPRFEGNVHFGNKAGDEGLVKLGQAWFESLNAVFFTISRPSPPLPQPSVTVACNTANNALNVSLPGLYSSYTWQTGQRTQAITVNRQGTYQATLKDKFGNTFLSPTVDVQTAIQPTVPTLSLASQPTQLAATQQQVCADSVLNLVANTTAGSTALWSNGFSGRSLAVGTSGTYSAQSINVYGCKSTQSAPITLTVRPKVPAPTIEQVGTYSLQATLPTLTGAQLDQFDWRRSGTVVPQTTPVIKVVVTASYSARTKSTFTIDNTNNLTCYSDFSSVREFTFDPSLGGLSAYPNPTTTGQVTLETIENLLDAQITVFSLTGKLLASYTVPVFDERKAVDLSNLPTGTYIIRVKSASFDVSRRVIVSR
ncbi:hypothetical protein GCM10027578_42010 [Spirosoma luteolum]